LLNQEPSSITEGGFSFVSEIFCLIMIGAEELFRPVETLFATNLIFIIELHYQSICVASIHRPESSVHFISIYPVEAYPLKSGCYYPNINTTEEMIALTTKRSKENQQQYKAEEWNYNTHQLIPAHYKMNRVGYFKKELREDMKSLAKKLKKFAGVTTTEWMVEKNKENKYYHAHLIIHGEDKRSIIETLLRHIGATTQRAEERWIERFKITKTYYRSLDGKWGEIYWTTAYDKEGAYEYLQKTERDFGEKDIFI